MKAHIGRVKKARGGVREKEKGRRGEEEDGAESAGDGGCRPTGMSIGLLPGFITWLAPLPLFLAPLSGSLSLSVPLRLAPFGFLDPFM